MFKKVNFLKRNNDFDKILLTKYRGKWVALSSDNKVILNKVILSDYNAKAVYRKAKEKGIEIPTLFKVPKTSIVFMC